MRRGGGIEYVRYTYKFLNFIYHRTHSVAEIIDINFQNAIYSKIEQSKNFSLELLNLYKHRYHRTLSGNNPYAIAMGKKIIEDKDLISKIKKLIANLDEASTKCVLTIIARLRASYLNPQHLIMHLSDQELKELREIENEFYSGIFQVSDEAFCYNGYFLPINHFEVGVFLHKHSLNLFSPRTLADIKSKDIIDVGGFIGDSAIIFEREFTDKKVYSFEATRTNFELLEKTLNLNESKRVVPVNKGLGARKETLEISILGSGSTMKTDSGVFNENNTQKCELITLDEFVKEHNLEVGFIKVDIEGFEQEFLKGALETIKTQKPAMLLSIYHNFEDFFEIKPFIESLNLGYKFQIFRPTDTWTFFGETALYCEVER